MATGHSILDTLNAASKGAQPTGPSGKFRTKDLPIDQLYRNEGNFYAIVEVEELAGMILTSGLLENLAVVYDPTPAGQYRIVSGERRWEALKLLVSRGHQEFAVATCNIRAKRSREEETVDLIAANSQRVKSITDQLTEYQTLKATLETMRAAGQKLEGYDLGSGRLRNVIAGILNKSTTKIAQIEVITGHLIPELKALLDTGGLKFSAAYALAQQGEDDQRRAYDRAMETGQEIKHKEVQPPKAKNPPEYENRNAFASKECERVNGECEHWGVIRANFMKHGDLVGCAGCCKGCKDRGTCDFRCEVVERENQAKAAKDAQRQQVTEAKPKTVISKCFSCENWGTCLDRNDKTTTCAEYRSKNAKPDQRTAGPIATYQDKLTQALKASTESTDDLIDMIRHCIRVAGLPEVQMEACTIFFDDLVEMWESFEEG